MGSEWQLLLHTQVSQPCWTAAPRTCRPLLRSAQCKGRVGSAWQLLVFVVGDIRELWPFLVALVVPLLHGTIATDRRQIPGPPAASVAAAVAESRGAFA